MQNQKHQKSKRAKIMSKNTTGKEEDKGWELTLGFYPGILLGIRSYFNKNYNEHVIYVPFIDICLTIDK
jgi:hypothetical protein